MAIDVKVLQGEVTTNQLREEAEVEKLLAGFLQALLEEQSQLVTQ